MRVTVSHALARGWISQDQARQMGIARRQGVGAVNKLGDPQQILFVALGDALSTVIVQEKRGLIPDRDFRSDIYLPESRVSVEMDGFRFHRSLSAYKKDRERQNLYMLENIAVLRYYAIQVFDADLLQGVVAQVQCLHERRKALFASSGGGGH